MKKNKLTWGVGALLFVAIVGGAVYFGNTQTQKGALVPIIGRTRKLPDLMIQDIHTYIIGEYKKMSIDDYNRGSEIPGNPMYVTTRLKKIEVGVGIANIGNACAENFSFKLVATDIQGNEHIGKYFDWNSPASIESLSGYGKREKSCPGESFYAHFVFDADYGSIVKLTATVDESNQVQESNELNNKREENGYFKWWDEVTGL